ncbi:hypothetical protein FFK22_027245 [Mycobacterium sp. KBS0706]|uniref:hypothetical protein n=1 Tax=Mycobacterium sp. KBS0706 TaxID=2578109 RepID=UPI00110FEB88|nr:hypothetical protein [Mycobacterium sp. KBS0706]TSD85462.1 hypothetical protein FFK22_027245 [Mycobacterium sp. KBS0706]
MLLRLLVEEENKFGSRQEKIDAVNRKITRGLVLIEKQSEIIERIHKNGGDISIAEKTLSLLRQSQEALTKFLSLAETG